MLRERNTESFDYFHYDENGELIAFLGLYAFGSTVEVCGMVKPSERRKRAFRAVVSPGNGRCKIKWIQENIAERACRIRWGSILLNKQGAEYAFSEHQMEWRHTPLEDTDDILLRQATEEDFEMSVHLSVTAFGLDEDDARAMENHRFADHADMLMMDVNEETVGKLRVSREEGQAWLWFLHFAGISGQRHRQKALRQVVKEQSSAGYTVHLEVETRNDHALRLYESVGFEAVHVQNYYKYECK